MCFEKISNCCHFFNIIHDQLMQIIQFKNTDIISNSVATITAHAQLTMGCGSSSSSQPMPVADDVAPQEKQEIQKKYRQILSYTFILIQYVHHVCFPFHKAPGEAFEVPFEPGESLIKKHPPKRVLQRLADTSNTSTVNLKDVEDKLANAEIRRNNVYYKSIYIKP